MYRVNGNGMQDNMGYVDIYIQRFFFLMSAFIPFAQTTQR